MIMNIEKNLRLYLAFLDELNVVKITANTGEWDRPLVVVGGVKGKEKLVDLLNEAGIDYFTTGSDSSYFGGSLSVACELEPKRIVEALENRFRAVDETQLKILRGEEPTAEERATTRPVSLHVFSSSTTAREGVPRVAEWIEKHAQQN